MRFIHFADLHIGVENYGRPGPKARLSSSAFDAAAVPARTAIRGVIDALPAPRLPYALQLESKRLTRRPPMVALDKAKLQREVEQLKTAIARIETLLGEPVVPEDPDVIRHDLVAEVEAESAMADDDTMEEEDRALLGGRKRRADKR